MCDTQIVPYSMVFIPEKKYIYKKKEEMKPEYAGASNVMMLLASAKAT